MIGTLTEESGMRKKLKDVLPRKKEGSCDSCDALVAIAGLLSLAKPDFSAIEQFREDDYFQCSLGLNDVPSEPTLRQRLDEIAVKLHVSDILADNFFRHNRS
jgi:hypothetical protein